MDVELLVITECPGADEVMKLLRAALDDIRHSQMPFAVGVVDTDEAAWPRRVAGSLAFIVDGTDPAARQT